MPPSSLSALLGELQSATPKDFDPDQGYDASEAHRAGADSADSASESGSEHEDQDKEESFLNPRAHYTDVGTSDMRRKSRLSEHEALNQSKYQGIKASRDEMFGDQTDEEEGDEEEDEEVEDEEDDEDDDDNDNEDEEEDEEEEEDEPKSKTRVKSRKQLRFQGIDQESDNASVSEEENDNTEPNTIASQLVDSQNLSKQLKVKRLQDAVKGRQVRRQIKTYERSLESRIKFQSILRNLNQLTSSPSLSEKDQTSAISTLFHLSDTLFSLRTRLLELNSTVDLSSSSRKRKREDQNLSDHLDHLFSLESDLHSDRVSILDKWSIKVSAAAASSSTLESNRFLKAVNQPPSIQISNSMNPENLNRLISRTQQLRDSSLSATTTNITTNIETPKSTIFDDTDFYSHLLKDLIERRNVTDNNTTSLLASSSSISSKKKKVVDTKASKGRKLRYDVHDKVQNFMPPIPRLTWSQEQIDRLFGQLATSSSINDNNTQDDPSSLPDQNVQLDGLRIFG